jgi:hypothetical protein
MFDEEIKEIRDNMVTSVEESPDMLGKEAILKSSIKEINNIIYKSGRFIDNNLVKLIRGKTGKESQFNQGLIARGFCCEINGDIYPIPLTDSYSLGLNSAYSYMVTTSEGSKSAYINGGCIKDSEYLHRKGQLVAPILESIHMGDCGSNVTYSFQVREGDLRYISGKGMVNDDGVVEFIDETRTDLIGKVINLRNPGGCIHPDDYGVCSTCVGELSHSFYEGNNVGHIAVTVLMGRCTQTLLSFKHLIAITLLRSFPVGKTLCGYLWVDANRHTIGFRKRVNVKDYKIYLQCSHIKHIMDVKYVDDTDDLISDRIGEIPSMGISMLDGSGTIEFGTIIESATVLLSKEMLRYINNNLSRFNIVTIKNKEYYSLPMDEFDPKDPLFRLPIKQHDMMDQYHINSAFLESTNKAGKVIPKLSEFDKFGKAAITFMDLTKNSLGVNLAIIELSILPYTIRGRKDYRMSKGTNDVKFVSLDNAINNRSLSAKLSYERHDSIYKPSAFKKDSVPIHHLNDEAYL